MPLIRYNRFGLLTMLLGMLALALLSLVQSSFVLDVPLSARIFILPILLGGIFGLIIGRAYFRIRDREQALKETEARLETILESVQAGIILVDAATLTIVDANDAALRMLGEPRGRIIGAPCHKFFCSVEDNVCPIMDSGQPLDNAERILRNARGEETPVLKTVSTVVLGGKPHLLESFVDITDRKLAQQEIEQLAYYDTLTGLPNRALLKDRIHQALARSEREKQLLAVIFLDLDHFKLINDTLGHSNGDLLLKVVAERLLNCVRRSDTVARLGGDEFVVVLNGIQGEQEAAQVAQKILDAIGEPVELAGQELFNSCSIGIALHPGDGNDEDTLLKHADAAMYLSKEMGRNTCQFFSRELNQKSADRLTMETSLRRGLERDEFVIHYQPQIDLRTGLVVGMEALIRWNHPELGMVKPERFIPLAEETGLIIPLGEWVIRSACIQSRAWQEQGLPSLRLAINLSPRQFRQKNLPAVIRGALDESGLNSSCLELELTESSLMERSEHNMALLRQLKAMGIHLSIDDFGTGFSSMTSLKLLPINRLKIAQEFVRDILTDPDDAAITDAIIAMAHSLKLTVMAEGVESREQMDYLRQRNCDEAQGFYFAQPMPADEFTTFLAGGWGDKTICFFTGEGVEET